MNAEIVFTGLCSFLNVNGKNDTMTEPSVILVRTDHHMDMDMEGTFSRAKTSGYVLREPRKKRKTDISKNEKIKKNPSPDKSKDAPPENDEHVAFIAFDTNKVDLTTDRSALLESPEEAPNFHFLRLDGVEIEIEGDLPGTPKLPDDSYRTLVVRKDDYWPEAANQWNRGFVPEKGKKPTDKSNVIAYLRFGSGNITAGKVCPFPWSFPKFGGGAHVGNFAEEVVYSNFANGAKEVVINLKDLETGKLIHTLRFSPRNGQATISIFIGNNQLKDIGGSTDRRPRESIQNGDHFKFLNRVADPALIAQFNGGPVPAVLEKKPGDSNGGGSLNGGPCGPENSNGAPPPP